MRAEHVPPGHHVVAHKEEGVLLVVPPILGAAIQTLKWSRRAKHVDPALVRANGFRCFISQLALPNAATVVLAKDEEAPLEL